MDPFLGPIYDPIPLSAVKPDSWVGVDVRGKPEEEKCLAVIGPEWEDLGRV